MGACNSTSNAKPIVAIATGNSNTGLATVKALSERYSDVVQIRAIVRSKDKAEALAGIPGVEVHIGLDVENPQTVIDAFAGASRAYIVPANFIQNRAEVAEKLVDGAKKAGVNHVVLLSVFGAQYESILFGKQFRQVEKHIEKSGLTYTFIRAAFFTSNFAHQAATIKSNGQFYGTYGEGAFPAVTLEDVGAISAAALVQKGHENKAYDVTGPEALTGAQYAAVLTKVLGKKVEYVDIPKKDLLASLTGSGWPQWQAEGLLELFDLFRAGHANAAPDDIKRVTGTHTTFEQWVEANKAAFV